ncbi:MAG: TetR/AcrR family transcriptional regulator [Solirubrobacteraceae bacterium]
MEVSGISALRPGLRERKKQQTREKIARVALELFAERGYEHTTLADIADAADVSRRTIFSYYESKEDILFCDEPVVYGNLKRQLDERPPDQTTIDVLREVLVASASLDENARMRKSVIHSDPALRLSERARSSRFEELIAESIARDLGAEPGDIRPSLVAASMTSAFMTVRDRIEEESGAPMTHDEVVAVLEGVLEFVRGGLDGMRSAPGG